MPKYLKLCTSPAFPVNRCSGRSSDVLHGFAIVCADFHTISIDSKLLSTLVIYYRCPLSDWCHLQKIDYRAVFLWWTQRWGGLVVVVYVAWCTPNLSKTFPASSDVSGTLHLWLLCLVSNTQTLTHWNSVDISYDNGNYALSCLCYSKSHCNSH